MKSPCLPSLVFLGTLLASTCGHAELQALSEESMSEQSGSGLGILPENLRIIFDPTAYIHAMPRGAPVDSSGSTGYPNYTGGTGFPDRAGDLYWYGFSFTGADGSVAALPTSSTVAISSWGTASNPWVFRALGTGTNEVLYNGTTGSGYPILQYSAPRYTDNGAGTNTTNDVTSATVMNLKYAFVGDLLVCNKGIPTYGSTAACGGLTVTARLRNLDVWDRFAFHGSRYSIFQSTVDFGKYMGAGSGSCATGSEYCTVDTADASTANNAGSFAAVWLNRINSNTNGVLRFGVGTGTTAVADNPLTMPTPMTTLPTFNTNEGIWITDLDINMPVGHLNYQPIIFDNDSSGNLILDVVRIPNNVNVYNYAYANYGTSVDPATVDATAPGNPAPNATGNNGKICTNASADCTDATHGQVRWAQIVFKDNSGGNIVPSNTGSALGTGGCTVGASTNVSCGSVLIDGIFLQHAKIKTLGL